MLREQVCGFSCKNAQWVHVVCTGAFGYLEITHDITKYCRAKVFSQVGKRTPIAIRFSTVGKLTLFDCG